ncbi:hypothetical membrane protein (DUF2157 domain) [Campylobacter pinnipediorum subsp. caledonicus]|uniref:Hypothetical membrane protein (DUF2157 domain) n=1 Tax=Campylobacter pinnipediorum subsp. caledonicus TaxID=1874362 RepID=A0A1S6U7N8_9BACT|nr:DUF2157 domain-containing protein [Campylobacter pinnipediorum]AQW87733.1 hypothetical membrane protein (DUF2157 domain) [Campylobacter pinnipediorum subsp. caledonicus]OPA72138.1 hypothetical protein BB381_00875 [Campylobacter pinnipediorum subsp. caledonicus]
MKNILAKEILKCKQEGIANDDFVNKISKRYDCGIINSETNSNFLLNLLAYLFFGLSLFFLVGSNWEEIPDYIRLILLVSLTLFLNISGLYTYKKGNFKRSEIIFFLAILVYGVSIALISQTYHLDRYMPDGLLLYAIGSMVLSVCLFSSFLTAVSLLISITWLCFELSYYDINSIYFIGFILLSTFVCYKKSGKFLVFNIILGIIIYLFALVYKISEVGIREPIVMYCFCILMCLLFFISLKEPLDKIGQVQNSQNFYNISQIFASLCLIFLSFVLEQKPAQMSFYDIFNNIYGFIFVSLFVINSIVAFQFKNKFLFILNFILLCLPIAFFYIQNEGLFFSIICIILGGLYIKNDKLFLGLLLIFSTSIIRYFEFNGDYISTSVLFLFFGFVMFIILKLKKSKK